MGLLDLPVNKLFEQFLYSYLSNYFLIHIYIYIYIDRVYIYIYIYIEREREREIER